MCPVNERLSIYLYIYVIFLLNFVTLPPFSCVSVKLSYMMGSRIVKSTSLIFQSQEVTVTQGLVVEYVCMSETQ